MTVSKVVAVAKPVVVTNGRARLNLFSGQDGSPSLADGIIDWKAADGGGVIALTIGSQNDPNGPWIEAAPIGVGTATVTGIIHEAGVLMTATLVATVTLVSGRLNVSWSSGTLTVH